MNRNPFWRGGGEIEGFIALAAIGLLIAGILWLFGFNFGVTSEGTVTYSDCRQVVTLKSGDWQTYFHNFTCSKEKTRNGVVMDGECVATKNDGLFGSGSTCETAWVYELPSPTNCKGNTKNGVMYPYLGYDDMCYTTPQGGEIALPAKDTIPPAAPSTGSLPTVVGQCDGTTVSQVGTRLSDGQGQDVPGSGSAINYADGGYQVSYDTVQSVQDWMVGDRVNLCLVSVPTNCPPGDNRGKVYDATNLRTGEMWEAQDSEHSCGGA